ncbi:MAG TPA: thiol reductant ABC exporter subunit CydD, partial [Stenotrophomonas sp.]|nr:thiol reductant ABC exporter subunit CydD [Stenotrophomonas sp.]
MSEASPPADAARQQRRRHEQWLSWLAGTVRGRQRVAALAACLSGALLVAQAGAVAWLIQGALVEHRPLAQLGPA